MKQSVPFTGLSLSGFCMQISILLKSAVPLYEGLSVMAEDASSPREKEILTAMSDKLRMGFPFSEAVSEAGCFPAYVTQMTVLGERTASCIYTQKGNKKIRKPQAANQTALIFDRRAAARLLSINSIRRLCWS